VNRIANRNWRQSKWFIRKFQYLKSIKVNIAR
jgi:hypothetical protein